MGKSNWFYFHDYYKPYNGPGIHRCGQSMRYWKKLKLGAHYSITNRKEPILVKLIKVTPMGYNLLKVKTNKCLLKRHLYLKKGAIHHYRQPMEFSLPLGVVLEELK